MAEIEDKKRSPSEMLMECLEDVEGCEKVIIIMQKENSLRWDSASTNPEGISRDEVQLLIQRTQTAIIMEGLGVFDRMKGNE